MFSISPFHILFLIPNCMAIFSGDPVMPHFPPHSSHYGNLPTIHLSRARDRGLVSFIGIGSTDIIPKIDVQNNFAWCTRLVACPNHRIRKYHALKTFWAKGYLAFTATCRSRNSVIFDVSGRASPLALLFASAIIL